VTVVVDASVAFKWVVEEEGSEAARSLLAGELLVAPELMIVECANALWLRVRRRHIDRNTARTALAAIRAAPVHYVRASAYIAAAHDLAMDLDQTIYDSLYLAVAIAEQAILVTGDRAFAAAVSRHAVYTSSVRLLGD